MRWTTPSDDRRYWHQWFAWYPVTIDGWRVWLEPVMRREVYIPCNPCGEFEWEYRELYKYNKEKA